ncbi:MAG TPA: GntR family transcriptional regulator, partial [Candidatus Brocadiia bacterium]|nr:GntR family transcriptional regulator [Candidatus Brocadiia bacterium]
MQPRRIAKSSKAIASDIEARIRSGELRPGESIPPIRELGESYGVAPMTIRRALSALCAQGKLKTEPGVGVFVSDRCPLEGVVFVSSFHERRERPWWLGNPEPNMAGAKEACAELGIPLIAASDNDDPRQFLGRGYGFLINFADLVAPEMVPWTTAIINARAPHVSVGFDHGMFNYMTPDFGAAISLALRHLRSLGHRRIAIVPRPRATGQPFFTHVGLPEAAGLDISLHPISPKSADTPAAIQEVTTAALKSALNHTPRPTALLAGNCGFV